MSYVQKWANSGSAVSGLGVVSTAQVSGLIGQTVNVIFNNGQSYGPAVFSNFGSAGKSAVFVDAAGIRAEYLLATIANIVPQAQPAQTYVIETPVFYGGGYYGGGGHGGHRRHHGHHHGIGSYQEYQPVTQPVAGTGITALTASTGSMIAAMIPMALVALGIMGVVWLVKK
jgi:hypothetical protein